MPGHLSPGLQNARPFVWYGGYVAIGHGAMAEIEYTFAKVTRVHTRITDVQTETPISHKEALSNYEATNRDIAERDRGRGLTSGFPNGMGSLGDSWSSPMASPTCSPQAPSWSLSGASTSRTWGQTDSWTWTPIQIPYKRMKYPKLHPFITHSSDLQMIRATPFWNLLKKTYKVMYATLPKSTSSKGQSWSLNVS